MAEIINNTHKTEIVLVPHYDGNNENENLYPVHYNIQLLKIIKIKTHINYKTPIG